MSAGRTKLSLSPDVLAWARLRSRLELDSLASKISVPLDDIIEWETTGTISVSRVKRLANVTHTPLGLLYLDAVPEIELPVADFRTLNSDQIQQPSTELIDVVFNMRYRQAWMRSELEELGHDRIEIVGSVTLQHSTIEVARLMRTQLGLSAGWAREARTWTDSMKVIRDRLDQIGILVVVNGVVGNNSHRKLNPDEFRGFALADEFAPLVFVNGADFKAAQTFSLVHEAAHIWLGESAISGLDELSPAHHKVEQWCNAVAAEFLVPESEFRTAWNAVSSDQPLDILARQFKVSRVVIARRALDFGLISRREYSSVYSASKLEEEEENKSDDKRGNFWNTQNTRLGRRFGGAVVQAVREGRLRYSEAYKLTGLGMKSFSKYAERHGY